MQRPDVRHAEPRRIPGAHIRNDGKYTRPCKQCGARLMMARMNGPHRFGWWAFDETPIDALGVRYYSVHECTVRTAPTAPG